MIPQGTRVRPLPGRLYRPWDKHEAACMAATNKCLAQSNKPGTGSKATKKRRSSPAMSQRQDLLSGQRCRLLHDRWYVSSPPSSDVPADRHAHCAGPGSLQFPGNPFEGSKHVQAPTPWQRRTNLWRKPTSPARAAKRQRSVRVVSRYRRREMTKEEQVVGLIFQVTMWAYIAAAAAYVMVG